LLVPEATMITVRRSIDRSRSQDAWLAGAFGVLEGVADRHLAPGARISEQPHAQAEVVTYVVEGALTYEDSVGRSGVVRAGEFQRVSAERGIRHRETNASSMDGAHVLQIALRASDDADHRHELRRFTAAERRNVLCLIASPDGRAGSLRVHQDVRMYAAVVASGHHLVRELRPGHRAWIHVVSGEGTLHEIRLAAGDGAGVERALSASFTARAPSEILLIEIGMPDAPARPR
jgi:redox-sensitive bicupin YhaK (pirin superfamily)